MLNSDEIEEISQKCGLFLEVERQRFVVAIESYQSVHDINYSRKSSHLDVRGSNNHVLELVRSIMACCPLSVHSQPQPGFHQGRSIGDAREQELGGLIQLVLETLLSNL